MYVIEQTYHINAPLAQVWEALTSAEMAEQWGAAPAKVNASEGGSFSYWGGDIHGTNTKVVPMKLIEQDWYGHDHPERKFTVTFTFETNDESTVVHLRQIPVQDDELQDMTDGWPDYYFIPIKKLLEK